MDSSRRRRVDAVVVAGLSLAAAAEAAFATTRYDDRIEIPLAVLLPLPLLVRRSRPLVAMAGVLAVTVVQRIVFGEIWDVGSSLAVPLVAVFAVAAYSSLPAALGGFVAAAATLSLADIGDGADWAFITLILGAIWLAGLAFHRQRSLVSLVKQQARALEGAAREREQLAAAAERTRIARELHDVVAHAVSTIVVQAEAGQSLQFRDPQRTAEAFDAIQASGRQALVELRRMLGVLRDSATSGDLSPQPGIADIRQLTDSIRAAGLEVYVEIDVDAEVTPGVELTTYRLVQEALTNTIKHAHATRVEVRVWEADGRVRLEVNDNGHGLAEGRRSGGHGLVGMRERAQLHDGHVDIVSTPTGFTVRAELPVT